MAIMAANIPPELIASLPPPLQAQIPLYNETLQPNLYAASTILFVAVWVAVGLRLYARRLKRQKLGWDDYLILIALGFYVPFYVCNILAVYYGIGRHQVVFAVEGHGGMELNGKVTLAFNTLSLVPLYFAKVCYPP